LKINTLAQLEKLALERRSVIVNAMGGMRMPAAFVINMQGGRIMRLLRGGMYRYAKNAKKGKRKFNVATTFNPHPGPGQTAYTLAEI
jgi:hypothetical protein